MIAICISQSQKGGSRSFHSLLDFLTNIFQVLTENGTPEMSCSNQITVMCREEMTEEHKVK